jgi:choline dehydrogenase-like flavoprotein
MAQSTDQATFDYIVVGSGAGGAPVAARLAQRGYNVLVLEAGSDAYPEYSQIPLLHPQSTEDPEISWQFMVRHYANNDQAGKDPKAHDYQVFYPRTGALGGCTIHNAMITICGGNDEWNRIAQLTGDDSWTGERMRVYFERLERCSYLEKPKTADSNPGRHGFDGWLTTSFPDFSIAARDPQLKKIILSVLRALIQEQIEDPERLLRDLLAGKIKEDLDPNDWRRLKNSPDGFVLVPLAIKRGQRNSPRDFLLQVEEECANGRWGAGRITIRKHALVTKVLFDDAKPPRAIGVEVRLGEHLYRADPIYRLDPNYSATYETVQFRCTREIILSGGTFNSPQLLMLSGVGPAEQLARLGLPCVSDLPGVGENLQDRYEVAIGHEMRDDFEILKNVTMDVTNPDPDLRQWREHKTGVYASNGALLGVFLRSNPMLSQPDLFIFALPGKFKGYYQGYSQEAQKHKNMLTWAILKASTKNRGGTVTIESTDPCAVPAINFRYFQEGTDARDLDLEALVHGIRYVESIERYREYPLKERLAPCPQEVKDDETLKEWIRARAWGHHACGTCRVGRSDDPLAVVDSRFRVRGVQGLRVVDASIFPEIPGFFIVTNTYMISEKAADTIIADAKNPIAPDFVSGANESLDVRERYWQRYIRSYPRELREQEAKLIADRRTAAGVVSSGFSSSNSATTEDSIRNDYVGFAISGGGIRSATFHLGLLQALARTRLFPRIDLFSSVSGGGYVAAFVGRLFTRAVPKAQNIPESVCQRIEDSQSEEVEWLRRSGNYIAPNGSGDLATDFGSYLRGFLTIQFILLLTLFMVLGVLNVLTEMAKPVTGMISRDYIPLGPPIFQYLLHLFPHTLSPIYCPTEFVFWTLVVGAMIAYWLASQKRRERFDVTALWLSALAMVVFIFLTLRPVRNFSPELIWVLIAIWAAFIWVEIAWLKVRADQGPPTLATDLVALQATRNLITGGLGTALIVFAGLFSIALVDTLGRLLWTWSRTDPWPMLLSLSGISLAFLPVLRMLAGLLSGPAPTDGWIAFLKNSIRKNLLPTFTVLLLALVPLSLVSFLVQAAYDGDQNFVQGASATAVAVLASILLRFARQLINRSSLQGTYAARLGRAFLGASNPRRRDYDGTNRVTDVIRGDDEPWSEYQPQVFGGPYHLINVSVNQTYNVSASEEVRDRKSENMVVSPLGVSVGLEHHALWELRPNNNQRCQDDNRYLRPIGSLSPEPHPFRTTRDAVPPEALSVQEWVAISGAAISPGAGRSTVLNHSLVFTLANLRTGYWWDSGANRDQRIGLPGFGKLKRWLFALPYFFSTQTLLINEALGNFGGPWFRTWYLSDGGFFEVTGGYELIRRRVRYILLGDSGEDPVGRFNDLSNLILKARIDFNAEIRFFLETADLTADPRIAAILRDHPSIGVALGGFNDLRPDANGSTRKHAALAFVYYDNDDEPGSIILYMKATRTGDEDPDVLHYAAENPTFPNESTGNQFFDEPQWESYRRLGEHIGKLLFPEQNYLWIQSLLP